MTIDHRQVTDFEKNEGSKGRSILLDLGGYSHAALKNIAKMSSHGAGDLFNVDAAAKQPRQRSYSLPRDPARDDHLEVTQISADVEGESMARDPAGNPYPNRTDLFISYPHTRQSVYTQTSDPKIRDRADQHFLDVAHVAVDVAPVGPEIDYGIADELAGTVIGDVPSAAGLVNFDRQSLKPRRIGKDVGAVRSAPQSKHVGMFEQQQLLRTVVRSQLLNTILLNAKAF